LDTCGNIVTDVQAGKILPAIMKVFVLLKSKLNCIFINGLFYCCERQGSASSRLAKSREH